MICLTPSEFGLARKKKTEESPGSILVTAAKGIGAAAGKVAAAVGIATPAKPRVPKLAKKHKNRLPRKQKKAAKKAARSGSISH
jgi:tRNA A37 threonylcarbamoyltransferase TsaD